MNAKAENVHIILSCYFNIEFIFAIKMFEMISKTMSSPCQLVDINKHFGQNPWSYKMFFCYEIWTECYAFTIF